jgi:hypothetical protein
MMEFQLVIFLLFVVSISCKEEEKKVDWRRGLRTVGDAADLVGNVLEAIQDCKFSCPLGNEPMTLLNYFL